MNAVVAVPTRILVGADDTIATPTAIADALPRSGRSDIELIRVDGEDHHIVLHRPGLITDVVATARASITEQP